MEFLDVLFNRRTTNGPFLPDPVSDEHQRLLIKAAASAPSQFNSQPWRFVVIEDRTMIDTIARISGESMTAVISEGSFFERYKRHFRFSAEEMAEHRSGMYFDKLPAALRPFTRAVYTPAGIKTMRMLRIPQTLGEENRKLVAGSPLILGVMLDKQERNAHSLADFYCQFSLGAAMENVWLTTVELGMGIQFISFPMEAPGQWERVNDLLQVPANLELMALYRLGYVPEQSHRPVIDWSSRERRAPSQFVFRETCGEPQTGWDED
ncbi:nitroreductase family protein [Leucobacter coleopterorum]|uniref:Nitroreductase family protein n=1 Tax=Leucobacter coleopterorum TaxID=2714933 RepID=A0ABX6JXY7_9MICO|nr:nitroreductase family protein [Leucobacter coleopterorum]QIM19166.1 nitroreductase family protein [Leucobacter coleopterorum]